MRPKDENQYGSMRPNLMSSSTRRASSEDNILAMLERDSARSGSSSRMAWYGTCSALALVLVGALAWLAYDSGAMHEDQVLTPVAVAPHAPAPAPVSTMAAEAPRAAALQPARAASIVDAAPEPARLAEAIPTPAQAFLPGPAPLVLLSPDQAASIQQAAAAHASAPVAEPKREAPRVAVFHAAPRKSAPRRELASAAAPHKRIAAKAPAPRIRLAAHAHGHPVAHPGPAPRLRKAQPAPPRAADAPVDSDVALISAIISRSSRHAEERPAAKGEARP